MPNNCPWCRMHYLLLLPMMMLVKMIAETILAMRAKMTPPPEKTQPMMQKKGALKKATLKRPLPEMKTQKMPKTTKLSRKMTLLRKMARMMVTQTMVLTKVALMKVLTTVALMTVALMTVLMKTALINRLTILPTPSTHLQKVLMKVNLVQMVVTRVRMTLPRP